MQKEWLEKHSFLLMVWTLLNILDKDCSLSDELAQQDSLNDSLKHVQDMSLRLSIDDEKTSLSESNDASATTGTTDKVDVNNTVKLVMSKMRRSVVLGSQDSNPDKKPVDMSKFPMLRKHRRLIVIAFDCYDDQGNPDKKMINVIQVIFKAQSN